MTDPYVLPGGQCLRNKVGLTDAELLLSVEAKIVSVRDVEIARTTIPGDYNLEHLKRFHRKLSVTSTTGPARP